MIKKGTQYIYRQKQLVVTLLVALIVFTWANTAFFTHTHILQSGKVTHSHPFANSHSHTVGDILAIDTATTTAALEIDTHEYQLIESQKIEYLNYSTSENQSSFIGFNKSLRAPPVSIS